MSVVEIRKDGDDWKPVDGSRLAHRITGTTPMVISGRRVLGMLNNCAGGETPWGTVLTAEENFNGYFGGDAAKMPDAARYKRYGVSKESWYAWAQHIDRFNVEKEPNEPNRFGWIVEIDPYDPASTPVKRTALGRLKHEGCHHALAKDGRVVVYTGDDHAALEGRWSIFLLAGRPGIDAGTQYHRAVSENGWLSCPDNCSFDAEGRIWIATDGAPTAAGIADGLYAADTQGMGRALTRLFFTAPSGAEICGPAFTPDGTTLFLAIQHPGEESGSSFEKPSTRWPDFQPNMPPRPSVVVITKRGVGVIGS